MAGLTTAGAIGMQVGGNLLGSGLNALFGGSAARKTRKHQKWLAMYQNQKNIEMWNMQNAYNTPKAQMERYKDAGLNPNLIYGQGNSGNASAIPEYQAYDPKYYQAEVEPMNMIGMLSQFQDFRNKKVVHDNLGKQGEMFDIEMGLKQIEKMKKLAETSKTNLESQTLSKMLQLKYDALAQTLKHEKLRTNITAKDWNLYKERGLRPQDPFWARSLGNLLEWLKGGKQTKTQKMLDFVLPSY